MRGGAGRENVGLGGSRWEPRKREGGGLREHRNKVRVIRTRGEPGKCYRGERGAQDGPEQGGSLGSKREEGVSSSGDGAWREPRK